MTDDRHGSIPYNKSKCLPTYVVLDTSASMKPYEQTLNDTLERLYDSLVTSPRVSEFAHISILSFNTDAHLVLEMTDIELVDALPQVSCGGSTNYSKIFTLLYDRIESDIPMLNAAGRAVLRPAVFFLTDGEPQDDWEHRFARLTDQRWRRRPHIITYGFGKADENVLSRLATKAAFLAEDEVNYREAISSVITNLLNTLVASARDEKLMIPTEVEGFKSVPIEYID